MSEDKRVLALEMAIRLSFSKKATTISSETEKVIAMAKEFYEFLTASDTEEKLRNVINEVNDRAAKEVFDLKNIPLDELNKEYLPNGTMTFFWDGDEGHEETVAIGSPLGSLVTPADSVSIKIDSPMGARSFISMIGYYKDVVKPLIAKSD